MSFTPAWHELLTRIDTVGEGATQGSVHGGTDFEEMGQTHPKRHSYEPDGSTSSTTAGESLAGLFTAVDTG